MSQTTDWLRILNIFYSGLYLKATQTSRQNQVSNPDSQNTRTKHKEYPGRANKTKLGTAIRRRWLKYTRKRTGIIRSK